MSGPLSGMNVLELAGLGPAPFCGMVLADLGATVIRVDRVDSVTGDHTPATRFDFHNRGNQSIGVNLKSDEGVEVALALSGWSEVLIEGFRPGVTERLGIGPAQCLARNKSLVYGRMTGWGQIGPFSSMAGHDIDFIAMSGALGAIGEKGRPFPPLNLVGDFGGGGMLLALGAVAAVLHARATGVGQVIDASVVDGSALLTSSHHGFIAQGLWGADRGTNLLDGGAPFYTTYETSDGEHMAVGALEPQFYGELLSKLDLDPATLPEPSDRAGWPVIRKAFANKFVSESRDHWSGVFEGSDACVAPILSLIEAPNHPNNVARSSFVEIDGAIQPSPAPRFSESMTSAPAPPPFPGSDTDTVLASLGYSPEWIGMIRASGAVA